MEKIKVLQWSRRGIENGLDLPVTKRLTISRVCMRSAILLPRDTQAYRIQHQMAM